MPTTREGFLWTPSATKSGLTTDASVGGTSPEVLHETYDVVVIGAGFAGLVAARDLSQRTNLKVLLLEGRDRIGGRTWTAKALGEEFEMGGTWIHWNQPHVFSEIHRYGLQSAIKTSAGTADPKKTYYTPSFGKSQEVDGTSVNESVQRVADAFFAIDGLSSRNLMPYPHDPFREPTLWLKYDHMSIKDRLDQLDNVSQTDKDYFDAMVSSFGSVPGSHCSFTEALRWYALGNHSMAGVYELVGTYKLGTGGMTRLARCVLSDFRGHVRFDTVVSKIEHGSQSVLVTSKDGLQVRASYAISTIPHNVLPDIDFSPPLPTSKAQAVQAGHINTGAKVHFHLESKEPGWFSMASGYGESPWCFAFSDHNGTADSERGTYCIGFGYSSHLNDPSDSKHIISSLAKHLKTDASVSAYLSHDWASDPLAKGAWSCWGPNGMSRWLGELQKSHGRVLFASADWANGWRGFIDGAIERGVLAAKEVEALLGLSNQRAKL